MSIKSEFGKQLEAYFSGEMKGADRLLFEGRVESDPMLKEEFEHQNDIVETLQAHRTYELKTRLSSISVEPTLIGSLLQSAALKPVIYGITSLAIMSGAYLFYNQDSAIEHHIQRLQSHRAYYTASNIQINKDLALNYKYENQASNVNRALLSDALLSEEKQRNTLAVNDIAFEVPDVGVDMVSDEFNAPSLALDEAKKIEQVPAIAKFDKVEINTVSSRRFGFHYRIEENRLFLYGKFNESPYEIIELNTPTSKSLFFYYNGYFYNLNKDANQVTPLSKIEDRRLTNRLNILKSGNSN